MNGPLTAGEPLAPPPSPGGPSRDRRQPKPAPKKKSPLRWLARLAGALLGLLFIVGVVGAVALYGAYRHFASDLPDVDGLRGYQPKVMSRVYAGDARLMSELAAERRIFVPYTAIPEIVKQAFVSAEDQNYWSHRGVDPVAIARAAFTDFMQMGQGRRPVGASTITQQVAKNMLLDNQLSLSRKIKEAILAMRIEESLTKERILELYLNEIYMGMQSYGVAAAAQAYFNKPLDELNIEEAAFLAALPKAPNNYNPFRYPDAAKARRDWVLDRMVDNRVITAAQAQTAKAQPIIPAQFRRPEPIQGADWFAEEVRRRLIDRFGVDTTTQGGLMVRTSLNPTLQLAAERALHDGMMNYDRKLGGWRGPVSHLDAAQAALRTDWASLLGAVSRPPGMLPDWKLGVVIDATGGEARVGWLERPAGAAPNTASEPKTGALSLSDLGWARPVHDGRLGGSPRRITDVVHPGDVVMIEVAAQQPAAHPQPAKAGRSAEAAPRLERVILRQIPQVQGALVSLDPTTGRIFAMVGGWSFETSQFNRVTQAIRQPGSSFKPIVYLTALEQGISPSQKFLDAPVVIDQGAAGQWRPNNYEMNFSGPVPLRIALEKSLNLVTVRVAERVGMEAVAQNAIAFHVVDNMPRVLPTALGAVDTTVLRMAGAYASLAQGGREVVPTLIDSVQDRDGHVVWRAPGRDCEACDNAAQPPVLADDRKEIADPQSVFQIVTMMQGVVAHGTGYEAGKGMNRPIAGKTGTTQDFNDAWFIGFTPDLVTAVWMGFDTPASLGESETGGKIAAPIWRAYMTTALKDHPVLEFAQPPGVTMARWDTGSGSRIDAFKPDQTPGASGPVGGWSASASSDDIGNANVPAGGVDSGMGGLY